MGANARGECDEIGEQEEEEEEEEEQQQQQEQQQEEEVGLSPVAEKDADAGARPLSRHVLQHCAKSVVK